MDKEKINWFEVLFWILLIILVVMILTRISGSSATDTQIYIGITMITVTIMGYIVKMNREIGEIKIGLIHSFNKIKEDTDLIKRKLKI